MISSISSSSPETRSVITRAEQVYTRSVQQLSRTDRNSSDIVTRSVFRESARREVIQRRINENQRQSLVQVADATLNELTPALYKLNELALRSLSTIISDDERRILHKEALERASWINESIASTTFNGEVLFDKELNLNALDQEYQLKETGLEIGPLLETTVPNNDHEIVLIFDPSRSLRNVDELFSKVVDAAQRYRLNGGNVSVGVAFTSIDLQNRHGQVPGLKDMEYHPPVSVTDDPNGENQASLRTFLDAYEFGVGRINFGDAIQKVHDQTDWSDDTAHSIVLVTTAGGEDIKTTIPGEIERFINANPRRHVSAVGVPVNHHTTSTYFDTLIETLDSGTYNDYSDDLQFDDVVSAASGDTRLISSINLSTIFHAEDSMILIDHAIDKLSAARSHLGSLDQRFNANIQQYMGQEYTLEADQEREETAHTQQAFANLISGELQLKQAIQYQKAERINHWQRFIELVELHT